MYVPAHHVPSSKSRLLTAPACGGYCDTLILHCLAADTFCVLLAMQILAMVVFLVGTPNRMVRNLYRQAFLPNAL